MVTAPDRERAAIAKAIDELGITDPSGNAA
jgi:hypothetical protein